MSSESLSAKAITYFYQLKKLQDEKVTVTIWGDGGVVAVGKILALTRETETVTVEKGHGNALFISFEDIRGLEFPFRKDEVN